MRKFAACGNSLSIHTVQAIPSEGPMTGSVISLLRSFCKYSPEHDSLPSYVFVVGPSTFPVGVAPAVMWPLCVAQFAHVRRHIPRLITNAHRFRSKHVLSESSDSSHGGAPSEFEFCQTRLRADRCFSFRFAVTDAGTYACAIRTHMSYVSADDVCNDGCVISWGVRAPIIERVRL